MLRVKARLETVPAAGTTVTSTGRRVVSGGAQTAHAIAGESKGNIGLLDALESCFSMNRVVSAGAQTAHANAGEDEGIFSVLGVMESSWLVPTAGGHEVKREFYGARRPREPDTERRL